MGLERRAGGFDPFGEGGRGNKRPCSRNKSMVYQKLIFTKVGAEGSKHGSRRRTLLTGKMPENISHPERKEP